MFSGSTSSINITSNPAGETVKLNGFSAGKTPTVIVVDKKQSQNYVTIEIDGYEPASFIITHRIGAGWVVLDILAGVVEIAVDAITGAWYSIKPSSIKTELTPISSNI